MEIYFVAENPNPKEAAYEAFFVENKEAAINFRKRLKKRSNKNLKAYFFTVNSINEIS